MFQDLGHEVIFLIGDFTGMIGDPSDKTSARKKLTRKQVLENAKTYEAQAGKILQFQGQNSAKIMFNSSWLDKLTFADLMDLSGYFTVQQLIERDMFQVRLQENKPIYLHEFLYPLMVTYDALAMEVDLELGGNDQMFNMTVGRPLIKDKIGKDKCAMTLKLLTDNQGNKIGKTAGNAINLFGDPKDLYGGIMSLPDDALINTFTLATDLSSDELDTFKALVNANPMAAKKKLAYTITKLCHSESAAQGAQSHFEITVQNKQTPQDIPKITIDPGVLSLLELCQKAGVGESNAQIKRVIEQGGVELSGTKLTDPNQTVNLKSENILKFGKRQFIKVLVR
jgi:tyrosyl-tRNA synthetase